MLKVNMEFRKGILFVRLKGNLDKNTYRSLLNYYVPLIINEGIKNVVFNVIKIDDIDSYGRKALKEIDYWTKYNQGRYLIVDNKSDLSTKFKVINSELDAFKMIEI